MICAVSLRLVTFVLCVCVCRGLFKDLRNLQKVLLSVFEVYWATQWVRLPSFSAFLSQTNIYSPKILTAHACFVSTLSL